MESWGVDWRKDGIKEGSTEEITVEPSHGSVLRGRTFFE